MIRVAFPQHALAPFCWQQCCCSSMPTPQALNLVGALLLKLWLVYV